VPQSGSYIVEQLSRDRWLHRAQRPEFTPFVDASSTLNLDVPAPSPRGRERTIQMVTQMPAPGDTIALTVRADGEVVRHDVRLRPVPPNAVMLPGDSARFARFRLRNGGRLMLPLARTWDVIPRVHPRRFTPGERWTDTIALATDYDGSRQALAGRRVSILLGDTVVGSKRLWMIRDSAAVRYTEHELQEERTLGTLVAVDRTATGTMRGVSLYDGDLGLFRERVDTTSLSGDAVLRYPDGRSFRTPAQYARTRRWTLYDPSAYATRQAEMRAERQRTSSGPVRAPSNETQRRLSSGDGLLRDSLEAAWARERDPNHRDELYRLLVLWAPGGRRVRDSLDARRIAAGDSAFLLEHLFGRAYPAQPAIERSEAEAMVRVMADPGVSFALGVARDPLYENLVQTFVTWPRALTRDSTRWRCMPEACRILEDQWQVAREPRLRDVGLAALATRDPARWGDSAVARAAAGSAVLVSVAQLANGVGATWPAAAHLSIPSTDADWRAWLAWMNAPNPAYRLPPRFRRMDTDVRFGDTHMTAIRFFQERTGRDVVGEITRRLAAATEDSARLVYGTILNGMGSAPTVEQVAAQLRSGSAPQITLAQRALPGLFGERGPLADSATQIAVLDRLIAAEVEGVPPWPELQPRPESRPMPSTPRVQATRPAQYVLADSVPAALRGRWRDRVRLIGADDWRRMPEREAATLLTLSSVERVGPFLRVSTQVSGRIGRAPNEVPRMYYGGTMYYLFATDGGWRIVVTQMWMT
jgi:hypothetical protein